MKKIIQFSAAALLVAGLSACSGTAAPQESPAASSPAAQEERAVPNVVGMSYREAYESLLKDDFFAQLVDETGAPWLTGSPWEDLKIAATDPAAGTMSSDSFINVVPEKTQEEYAATLKTAE